MFLLYSLIALISFLGLLVGMILTYSNKDELKPGRKYIILVQKIIWTLIMIVTAFVYNLHWFVLLLIFIFTISPFFNKKQIKTPSIYFFFGIIFYLSTNSINLLAVNASLIFLFGLPSGTLIKTDEKSKIKKGFIKELAKNLGFFICIPLFLLL